VDGNDPIAVYHAAKEAIERARAGGGPTLIEAMTFRFNGHLIGDAGEYIPKDEYQAAIAADPYPKYRHWLITSHTATESELQSLESAIQAEIDEAVEFAMNSATNSRAESRRDVFGDAPAAIMDRGGSS
jgi:pyruvate dehydrogenase E1 component alpha subunit